MITDNYWRGLAEWRAGCLRTAVALWQWPDTHILGRALSGEHYHQTGILHEYRLRHTPSFVAASRA